ncbi:PREDICTED: sphingosine kinase 1-like isoform X1 [Nelumbo nucifera]|nr:PREDICTED: sphingosine kinase 1-like isoform X1 [Nelumbo nucifera]
MASSKQKLLSHSFSPSRFQLLTETCSVVITICTVCKTSLRQRMDEHEGETLTIFERVKVNGTLTPITFSVHGRIRWADKRQRCLTVEKDVLGFVADGSTFTIKAMVEKDNGISCVGNRGNRVRKDFVIEPLSQESHQLWCRKLQECIDSLDRPKRLFIIVNPFGGKKFASWIFQYEVKPLLEAANVQYTVQETKYQLHAKEIAQTLDISKYDGIVCISGDGVLVEVVNGLLQRDDWDAAIKMPIGIIPAGTGNGMIKSLLDFVDDPCSVSNATLSVIRGHKCSLDVITILQGETKFFSVLMLAWGLIADIDIESEKYRWMGSARLDFYALVRIIHKRRYNGRLSFVPAPGYETYGEPSNQNDRCTKKMSKSQEDSVKSRQHGYQGPEISLDSLEWRTIDGPFVSVWLHNVPWGSEDTMAAPDAKFSDGYLDLIIIKNCPRASLLALMSKLSDGSYVKSPYVLYLKVKAFILEPGQRFKCPTKGGIIDSDGEVLARGEGTYNCEQKKDLMAYDRIQMTVDQGLATLFSPR